MKALVLSVLQTIGSLLEMDHVLLTRRSGRIRPTEMLVEHRRFQRIMAWAQLRYPAIPQVERSCQLNELRISGLALEMKAA